MKTREIACRACEHEIDFVGECRAERFSPIQGRAGRHGGRCWGGFFPRQSDDVERRVVFEDSGRGRIPPDRLRPATQLPLPGFQEAKL
jgi:hypothetical protein